MVKIVYRVLVKRGVEDEFTELTNATRLPLAKQMPECVQISFFQNTSNKRDFLFTEQWQNEESIHNYMHRFVQELGDPHPGEEFPAVMNDMVEEDEDLI